MARRGFRDRVASRRGAVEFDTANRRLPTSAYRDFQTDMMSPSEPEVYLERSLVRGTGRRGFPSTRSVLYAPSVLRPVVRGRWIIPPLAKQILRNSYASVRAIARPSQVNFCVKRRTRKEVLFASKVAGRRGVGLGKRRRLNLNSLYRC